MKLRTLAENEWEVYKAIRLEALKNDGYAFGSNIHAYIEKDDEYWIEQLRDNKIIVVENGLQTIGVIRINLHDTEIPSEYAYIGSLYVAKKFRSNGLATSLIREAEELVGRTARKGIYLDVYRDLDGLRKYYERLGYEVIGKKVEDGRVEDIKKKTF